MRTALVMVVALGLGGCLASAAPTCEPGDPGHGSREVAACASAEPPPEGQRWYIDCGVEVTTPVVCTAEGVPMCIMPDGEVRPATCRLAAR